MLNRKPLLAGTLLVVPPLLALFLFSQSRELAAWLPELAVVGLAVGVALHAAVQLPARHWWLYLLRPLLVALPTPAGLTEEMVTLANTARKDGILALETIPVAFPPLLKAKNLCVDGVDPEFLGQVMERERQVVLDQVAALRQVATTFLSALMTACVFLSLASWQESLEILSMTPIPKASGLPWGGVPKLPLLAVLALLLILIRWRLHAVAEGLEQLYRLVEDGVVGILRGINPRVLDEMLRGGEAFNWTAAGITQYSRSVVTGEEVGEKLEQYLATHHPALHQVDLQVAGTDESQGYAFHELMGMDDRSFQVLLREVEPWELVMAIKWAAPELVRKMMANLSAQSANDLLDELRYTSLPDTRRAEAAQEIILRTARKLEADGCIVIQVRRGTVSGVGQSTPPAE